MSKSPCQGRRNIMALGIGELVLGAVTSGCSGSMQRGVMKPVSQSPTGSGAVRFVGRVDARDRAAVRFAWSGTGFVARFRGTHLKVRLKGGQEFAVIVDGEPRQKLAPSGDWDTLAGGLRDAEHVVEVYRRTEASQGESQFLGVDVGEGTLLPPPPSPARRLEIVGDSISCGYGNEGADQECPFTPATENHYLSYGAIAARALGAELSTVAWSGKGVVCNYGDKPESCRDPMPTYYDKILPERSDSLWDFARFQPHAVIINLGTNDFSTESEPTAEQFTASYVVLLEQIRRANPKAAILCSIGPMLSGDSLSTVRTCIDQAIRVRQGAGEVRLSSFPLSEADPRNGYGCDWHPSLRTHELMAKELVAVLQRTLTW